MGNTLCDCFLDSSSSSSSGEPVKRNVEASLSESIKLINQLDSGVATLEESEKTLQEEIDELVSQIKQESDSKQKKSLIQRLAKKKTALRNIKCEKARIESLAHKKLIDRSKKVSVKYQRETSEASTLNEELGRQTR